MNKKFSTVFKFKYLFLETLLSLLLQSWALSSMEALCLLEISLPPTVRWQNIAIVADF